MLKDYMLSVGYALHVHPRRKQVVSLLRRIVRSLLSRAPVAIHVQDLRNIDMMLLQDQVRDDWTEGRSAPPQHENLLVIPGCSSWTRFVDRTSTKH